MSEVEKINQPTDDNSPSTEENKITEQLQTNEMEVHKHPHHVTHKKQWGEYLLEFFMLFLAVFLGFIAENLREHSVEQTREKEYIKSMIEDLKIDSAFLNLSITKLIPYHIAWMDSTEYLLNAPNAKGNDRLIYQAFIIGTSWTYDFHPTDRTLSQLRSAGFYLIRNKEAAKVISNLEDVYKLSLSVNILMQNMQNDIDVSAFAFADRSVTKKSTDLAFKNFPIVNLELTDIPASALIKTGNKQALELYIANLRKYSFYLGTGIQTNYEFELKEITKAIRILEEAYNLK